MNDSLQHHGILGQKWGVRRYQNRDGTLTEAGRKRVQNASPQNAASDHNNAANAARSAGSASKAASDLAKKSANRKRQKEMEKIDVSDMSDEELQAAINRMNMEKKYKILSTENIKYGRDYVSDILSTAGDVLIIGASISSVMVGIHMMRS